MSTLPASVEVLALIVSGAVASVPHVDRAGISLVERDGTVSARTPSDEVVAELDQLQNTVGEGPCRDTSFDQARLLVPDMAAVTSRWPRFAPAATERGVGSMVSFQLFTKNGTAGALNLYAGRAGVFGESSLEVEALFASHAAIALYGAQQAEGLGHALASRDVIGQAKGILMERFGVDADKAFAMLVAASQDTNLKLHAVAEWLSTEVGRGRAPSPTP